MSGRTEDERFMAAAIRLCRRNLGLTATNPSVACLIVKDGVIVASAVTAPGGRPHAETQALAEAGEAARGATAYVTLEPCSHHGKTPPCADALIAAGVARVVVSVTDPDERVAGRGLSMLRDAGIAVETGVLESDGRNALAAYLTRQTKKRPHVTLKLAVSTDGMLGRLGAGQVAITGPASRGQVHVLRAETDAILIGIGTALADDPELTCRLPGLETRSPVRIVLDPRLELSPASKLARTARQVPVIVVTAKDRKSEPAFAARQEALEALGVEVLICDPRELDALLAALATRGISSLLVEGGARAARSFLDAGLVDRIMLFTGAAAIGKEGVASPFVSGRMPDGFSLRHAARYGADSLQEYERDD
ncbi:bifunctional diaminohydroxyphosphoribosylaminopyrimidine deaminase/5-amino-6-(5-phosphoribosylamino)uracil reductase RibD [Shinella zoogloeoides]|uniref:bifunctional diaminohydroxyphosphoribosylaminopyrimidine deaminase/5-amino-6-(5-phosphoribosylamino)uracil reductase RibD n=1 Tax=Shinella zoogloeoides TaxID=352475 RepID=UPI00273F6C82|nr:bifunctional diaminohydroxyphosphoribosylaminopyrimidine deaminase/5-amino-6-(5-phosphoribosylamino)uracil reductase RibD [Shinella zoogloeoides]WLR93858.1 bifunctional diaminohydroxyphosphoribosylaminopyrimidine deaminase/5-amino-6-(5-phosphoribosylamino)uracil reductase RibD [Shinella zoogloeoides]